MPKQSILTNIFNAGELGKDLYGRTDFAKYFNGARTMENFLPITAGPAVRRAGTRFVEQVEDNSIQTLLVPFIFSTEQAYILEFGDGVMRVFKDRARVLSTATKSITNITQANPAVVSSTSHGKLNGQRVYISGVSGMTEMNGRWVTVANKTASTFECKNVDSTNYSAYTSGGTVSSPYEIVSPYSAASLFDSDGTPKLKFTQSADVLYITHPDYEPRKLSRTGHTSWSFETIEVDDGPFRARNIDESVTIYSSVETGTGALVASSATFTSDMVGALVYLEQYDAESYYVWEASHGFSTGNVVTYQGRFYECTNGGTSGSYAPIHDEGEARDGKSAGSSCTWLYLHNGSGIARITSYTSPTIVGMAVVSRIPSGVVGVSNKSYKWAIGAFSDEYGWPSVVSFYENRLAFGATTKDVDRIDMSRGSEFTSFRATEEDGTVQADSAFWRHFNSSTVNKLQWMVPSDQGLLVGTTGGPWVVKPSSLGESITPANANAKPASAQRCSNIQGILAGEAVIYVQNDRKTIRELVYRAEKDGYAAPSLTLLARHITRPGLRQIVFQQSPDSIIWCVRDDGVLVGMSYERTEDVIGLHRHTIAGDGEVESIAVIPSPDGSRDDLWMTVKRTIDGETRRYVEYLEAYHEEGDAIEDVFYYDSGLTYDGASASVITGLDHLEGETIGIIGDGMKQSNKTVTGGNITLDRAASKVQAGLPFTSVLETMNIEAGGQDGTGQNKTKRIHEVILRCVDTIGGKVGPGDGDLERVEFTQGAINQPPPFECRDYEIDFPGDYGTENYVRYETSEGYPAMITALMAEVRTY